MTNDQLSPQLKRLGTAQDRILSVGQAARAHAAEERLLSELARRRKPRTWLRVAAPSLALAGLALVLWLRHPAPEQTRLAAFAANGSRVAAGSTLRAPANASLPLAFSEGSLVMLQPQASAQLVSLQSQSVDLRLNSGGGRMHITPGQGVAWRFHAGPFVVNVTGTAFDLQWRPEQQQFEIALHEGSVVVNGPLIEGSRRVSHGESLQVDLMAGVSTFQDHAVPPARETAPPATRRREPSHHSVRKSAASTPHDAPAAPALPSWSRLAEAGQFQASIEAAEAQGLTSLCNTLAPTGLLQLADTARAAKQENTAASVYTCLRRRFARSNQAALAAYMLGRIASEIHHNPPQAAKWFQTYLNEQPAGPLAETALGRLMETHQQQGHVQAARQEAQRYLQRHPQGPHAALARSLLSEQAP